MKITDPLRQPRLRRWALALAATALSSFVAQAVPYASQVTRSGNTVSFVLNQAASGIAVLRDGANPVTPAIDATTSGVKSFDMTGFTSYSIIVTGNTAKGWVKFIPDGPDRNFYFPNSVAINKNPASTNFGKVYICNNNLPTPGNTGAGRTTYDGIYVLQADGVAIGGVHDGGLGSWMTEDTNNYSRFYKININPDDNCIYASSYFDDLAFGFNEDLSVATQLIDASNKTTGQYVESVYATGSKAAGNRMLYTVDSRYGDSRVGLIGYSLGANDTVTASDTGSQVIGPTFFSYYPGDVDRDSSGNWYLTQYRGTAGQASAVTKFDGSEAWPINTAVWGSSKTPTYIRCVGVNEAGGLVAAGRYANSSGLVYFYDINTGADAGSLDIGNYSRDIAFDRAGNMVSVDNSTEYARFWDPGGFSVAITKSDGTFSLRTTDALSVAATDAVASEAGPETATFTISRTGNLANDLQVSFTLTGTATSNVDYTVYPTSPFTFPASQSTVTITITPTDDGVREPTENVVLTLVGGGSAYSAVSPTSATAILLDNNAPNRYWDANGSTAEAVNNPGDPANGVWGTDAFWSTDPTGATATSPWTDWSVAVFSAGSYAYGNSTVTINGTQKADTLFFKDGNVTLEGGTLTLTNFSGIQVASSSIGTINSVLGGNAGLTVDGPGIVVLGGANAYTGPTLVNSGTVQLGAADRIPDASAVTLGNSFLGTVGTLDLLNYSETIGSLDGVGTSAVNRSVVNVPGGQTLVFGGNNNSMFFDGTTTGDGLLAKVGTGTLDFGVWGDIVNALAISNGILHLDSYADLGPSSTATPLYLDGGKLQHGAAAAVTFVPASRSIIIGAAGGTIEIPSSSAICLYGTALEGAGGTIQGGVLTCQGAGELRTYNNRNSFSKLIVKDGFIFTSGQATYNGYEDSYGAVPTVATADAITLQTGGQIRKVGGANVALDPKQGIFLGTGGGVIRSYDGSGAPNNSGTFEIGGTISGGGPLQLSATGDAAYGPIIVLDGANTYSGPTTIASGKVFARNTSGSATGSGAVTVAGGTLGGDGILGGPVVVQSILSPGYNYNTGPQPVGFMDQSIAKLTVTNGLNLSTNGTYAWQLGALSTANPGADFDQVSVTGGNLALGGTSVLALGFTNSATAPDTAEPFWQQNRQWQIIKFSGAGSISGNFSAITGTNGITAGWFTTTTSATGVDLVFTLPGSTSAVTNMSVIAGPGAGQITIGYAGGSGSQFVLMRTNQLTGSIVSREGWERVATTNRTPASFTITPGSTGAAFYYIKSE